MSYFTARLDAKTAHSLATEGFEQRRMVVKEPHQIGMLFFSDPLAE